jgi:hypothetical protein
MTSFYCRPMPHRPSPAYPTKLDALAASGLLEKHVPLAWLGRREIAGALGAFLAVGAAGCRPTPAEPENIGELARLPGGGPAIVAPVFQHGEGRGRSRSAMACIAIASPVYLTEAEALIVIAEELRKAGLNMSGQLVKLDEVIITGHEWKTGYEWVSGRRGDAYLEFKEPLRTDLADLQRSVAVEFISYDDFDPLGGNDREGASMDFVAVATAVDDEVRRQARGLYFAAFYDPTQYMLHGEGFDPNGLTDLSDEQQWQEFQRRSDEAFNNARDNVRAKARELLRLQVQDFVAWLKGQGVI